MRWIFSVPFGKRQKQFIPIDFDKALNNKMQRGAEEEESF